MMKAAEKEQVYQLLKKTSGAVLGYTSQNFLEPPVFVDDPETSVPAQESAPPASVALFPRQERMLFPEKAFLIRMFLLSAKDPARKKTSRAAPL